MTTTTEPATTELPAPKPLLGLDTETFLIDQKAQLPRLVCLSMNLDGMPDGSSVIGDADPNQLEANVTNIIHDRAMLKVGQNLAYDLGVFATNYPHLLADIFLALDAEAFSCTMIREKLLNLADTGDLRFLQLPDGSKLPIKYGLDSLLMKYEGIDIKAEKQGADAWRTNYGLLSGIPVDQWPTGARTYALDDADYPIRIWKKQEARRQELIAQRGIDPFATESFRLMVDFCLKLMSNVGMATDPAQVAVVEAMLARELAPEKLNLLIESGILRPGSPPRPHKKGATEPCGACKATGVVGEHEVDCGKCEICNGIGLVPKMTAAVEESIDTKKLKEYVLNWSKALNTDPCPTCNDTGTVPSHALPGTFQGCNTCKASGRVPKAGDPKVVLEYTDPSDKFPEGQLSTNSDFMAKHAHLLDDTLKQYQHRQELQKLVTTEIPRMKLNGVVQDTVYPQYDCLKETGRTSSFASKPTKEKPQLSAQFNCQNVDPRVRGCYVPRPGTILWSADYSQMELASLAERCFQLFGYSVLRDKINAGVDVHAYTGAQLAFAMDPEFQKDCIAHHGNPTPEQIFDLFVSRKKFGEETDGFKHYKHWRKFAKPVNLGYPGGLGAKTFVTYAAGEAYGVHVTEEEADTLRALWKQTYPEMVDYFAYINKKCVDPWNKGWDEEEKQEYAKYAYDSPYGMHRAGCDYCACANGLGLQTHSADGALTALIRLIPACFVQGVNDILGPVVVDGTLTRTVTPIMFIHDEFVGEIVEDDKVHERCMEIKRIMVEAMQLVTPNVRANANVCLMRRWDKAAEPVFDSDGRLNIWTPKK